MSFPKQEKPEILPYNLLMGKDIYVRDNDADNHYAVVLAFLDTGAQRIFISPDFAKRLKLTAIRQERFGIQGFNGSTAEALSNIYRIKILARGNMNKVIEVAEVENLIGNVHYFPNSTRLNPSKLSVIDARLLALERPGIIIGIPDFWSMGIKPAVKLPSGFNFVDSDIYREHSQDVLRIHYPIKK